MKTLRKKLQLDDIGGSAGRILQFTFGNFTSNDFQEHGRRKMSLCGLDSLLVLGLWKHNFYYLGFTRSCAECHRHNLIALGRPADRLPDDPLIIGVLIREMIVPGLQAHHSRWSVCL